MHCKGKEINVLFTHYHHSFKIQGLAVILKGVVALRVSCYFSLTITISYISSVPAYNKLVHRFDKIKNIFTICTKRKVYCFGQIMA